MDEMELAEALEILDELADVTDIIEIGTPLIIRCGIEAVKAVKSHFSSHQVLADLKIMDAGSLEAQIAFEAGADIVTVLGVADNSTIRAAGEAARKFGREIMVDMIGTSDLSRRTAELEAFDLVPDYICVHIAFDVQGTSAGLLKELFLLQKILRHSRIAVAGGIRLETLDEIVAQRPDIVIVGGGIICQPSIDRRRTAEKIKTVIVNGGGSMYGARHHRDHNQRNRGDVGQSPT
jgi:3-hexulose-6-phosphate synthase